MPLSDAVSFDVWLQAADIAERRDFPPERFAERDTRLAALAKLWRGDFSDAQLTRSVPINYFHAYSVKVANLLMMSPPEVDADITDGVYDAIIDMTRYGGTVLTWDGETLAARDPLTWYPRLDGDTFAVPFLTPDATDSTPNRIRVLDVETDGAAKVRTFDWHARSLGNLLETEAADPMRLAVVARTPRAGIWGTSKYPELHAPVIEIARTYGRTSRTLELFGKPIPVFKSSELNAEQRYGVDASDTDDEKRRAILTGQLGEIEEETLHLPNDLVDVSYLQPETDGVVHGIEQADAMGKAIEHLTGMPALTGEQQPPSGEALKRIFLHFYAETLALQESLVDGLSIVLGVDVPWLHIFDVMEAEDLQHGRGGGRR